jgi:hypothetical protein
MVVWRGKESGQFVVIVLRRTVSTIQGRVGEFDEDEFLVDKEGMGGGVNG